MISFLLMFEVGWTFIWPKKICKMRLFSRDSYGWHSVRTKKHIHYFQGGWFSILQLMETGLSGKTGDNAVCRVVEEHRVVVGPVLILRRNSVVETALARVKIRGLVTTNRVQVNNFFLLFQRGSSLVLFHFSFTHSYEVLFLGVHFYHL